MTSLAASAEPLADVRGIVFFGFPLHAPGKPGTERAAHLSDVTVPLLFLQGTRDTLAKLELIEPVIENLGNAATLHVADGADHGFHVQKRSGRTDADVMDELADAVVVWARTASLA
jgi:predicted alpha/beta-hydrolase family hydrolase